MALRLCNHPTCGELVEGRGYCPRHQKAKRDVERRYYSGPPLLPPPPSRYYPSINYGRRWQKLAKTHLAAHPFCVDCVAGGNPIGLATDADHRIPHRGDPALFWDPENLDSRCKEHHSAKTAREVGWSGARDPAPGAAR